MQKTLIIMAAALAMAAAVTTAKARPVSVDSIPVTCDAFGPGGSYHELGLPSTLSGGSFPADQAIIYGASQLGEDDPCGTTSGQPGIDTLVSMTNLTSITWHDVWFVADPNPATGTPTHTNVDALIGEGPTPGEGFRIDTTGINVPLIFEDIASNELFEPGETWEFVIQDWYMPGIVEFTSIGIGGESGIAGAAGLPLSNASIIARPFDQPPPIPEPATLGL